MSIRNKLILMLALPLAALAIVGALGFRSQSSESRSASDALVDDEVVQSINTAIKSIGTERLAVAEGLRGLPLAELRSASDAALEEVLRTATEADQLEPVEDAVLDAQGDIESARFGSSLLDSMIELNHATADLREARDNVDVNYPSQSSFAEAISIDMAVDIADRQDSIWLEYIASDSISSDLAARLRSEIASTDLLRDQIIEIAPESHTTPLNASLGSEMDADIERAGLVAIDRFNRAESPLADEPTLDLVIASHDDWYGHAVSLQNDVEASLEDRSADAKARQNLFALLATLGLLVLAGLIYVVYRSVVRPLDELLVGAEDVAANRLPTVVSELRTIGSSDENVYLEPLPRETDDELGSLVDAFNDVQLTAFELAVEQARSRRNTAEMFVNLGRRNQKLLQRMLGVISDLEHDEKNPDKLEQLFQLDHMTTRMRRNAESLLVVAGTKSPRQWAKPIPAADVVRSALAEVQDYHRVDILSLADAPMAGNAVADITHMLAELLENSLQFSEPETRVSVSSRWMNGNYRIVITDQGFGMTTEELEENNRLIANPPPPDQAPTRFLGLFVVGHLAARHQIEVVLTDATIGGTDARVTIPGSVMSEASPSAAGILPSDLPSRSDLEDLDLDTDLDAELAKLTAESDRNREPQIIDDAPAHPEPEIIAEDPAPASAEKPFTEEVIAPVEAAPQPEASAPVDPEPLPDLPVRGAAPAEATAPVVDSEALPELPVRGGAAPSDRVFTDEVSTPPAETSPAVEVGSEAVIDFDEVPEVPRLDREPRPAAQAPAPSAEQPPTPLAPAPVAEQPPTPAPVAEQQPVAPAPAPAAAQPVAQAAPDLPVRGHEAAPAAEPAAALMGLPQRTPKASLKDVADMPMGSIGSAATADDAQDINTAASSVGSMFSSLQAGIQRSERSSN